MMNNSMNCPARGSTRNLKTFKVYEALRLLNEGEKKRNLKTFCYRVGRIETSMLRDSFYSMCRKSKEKAEKGGPASREKLMLRDCRFCPMGEAIERGKEVCPSNIKFINFEERI